MYLKKQYSTIISGTLTSTFKHHKYIFKFRWIVCMNRKLKKIEKFVNANESIIDLKIKTNALADLLSDEEEFYKLSCRMRDSGRFIKTQIKNGRIHIINSNSSNIRAEYYANHIESKRTFARFFNTLTIMAWAAPCATSTW